MFHRRPCLDLLILRQARIEIVLSVARLDEFRLLLATATLLAIPELKNLRLIKLLLMILLKFKLPTVAGGLQLVLLILPIELNPILVKLAVEANRSHLELLKQIVYLV